MKHLFIINPAAGKKDQTEDFTRVIHRECSHRGLDYEIRISSCKGDCTRLTEEAARSGAEYRIYACGGDGTLNEVVNGAANFENVAVTHFPGGSGNDFIRNFSQPEAFSDLGRLLDARETQMDLIRVNDRAYSLNICSMGIDARIAAEVQRYKRLPGISGHGAYNLSLAVNLIKGIRRYCEVEIDGQVLRDKQTLVCICNGRFYGGGFNPVPEARPDDGLLDVLIIKGVSLLTAARVIGKYKRGEYASLPRYITYYRVKELTIRFPKENVINVDGESLWDREATFSVLPRKLRFFYPKGLTYAAETEENSSKTEETSDILVKC